MSVVSSSGDEILTRCDGVYSIACEERNETLKCDLLTLCFSAFQRYVATFEMINDPSYDASRVIFSVSLSSRV